MKPIFNLSLLLISLFSFSQELENNNIYGNWTTNPSFPDSKIVIGDLDGSYLFSINSTSVNNPDVEATITREGKSDVKLTEGSAAIVSSDKTTSINYSNNETLPVSGKWIIFDLQKTLKGLPAQWNISSIGNKTTTTVLDTDVKFFFVLNINPNQGCNNPVLNVKIDNVLVTNNQTNNAFSFIEGNAFVGYGKKIELILASGTCPNLKVVNGTLSIFE